MRVSKAVKEYIEKQVNAKYPKTENELNHDNLTDVVNKANEQYHKLMEQAKEKIVEQLQKEYELSTDMIEKRSSYSYSPFSTWGTKEKELAETDRQNRRVKIYQKVEDIIVTLELGGTKADLEKMLAEI
jgi:hypothetical protein